MVREAKCVVHNQRLTPLLSADQSRQVAHPRTDVDHNGVGVRGRKYLGLHPRNSWIGASMDATFDSGSWKFWEPCQQRSSSKGN